MSRCVGILSGKGGVGKTTTTLNLALALREYKRDVCVLDANIGMPNVAIHLGCTNLPTYFNHVLQNKAHISEAVYRHTSGMKVIPSSIKFKDINSVKLDEIHKHVNQIKGKTELLLIDCPPGLNQDAQHTINAIDEAIVVTNPDLASVTDTLRTIHYCEEKGVSVLGVIINKIRNDKYEMSPHNIASMLDKVILGQIPSDTKVKEALNTKHPVVFSFPEAESSKSFKNLAIKLIGSTE